MRSHVHVPTHVQNSLHERKIALANDTFTCPSHVLKIFQYNYLFNRHNFPNPPSPQIIFSHYNLYKYETNFLDNSLATALVFDSGATNSLEANAKLATKVALSISHHSVVTLLSLSDWNLVALRLRRDKIKAEELKDVRILSNKKGNKVEYSTFIL